MAGRYVLTLKIAAYTVQYFFNFLSRSVKAKLLQRAYRNHQPNFEPKEISNIVIIGASFAGYHAAKVIAESLPPDAPYRVVVIEPNTHFQFTWLLPRFSVVSGHESKLFIPYGPYINYNSERVNWIRDRAVNVTASHVHLRDGDEPIPWKFLVIATGSGQTNGLPSRVGVEEREEGIKKLRGLQKQIETVRDIVVVGGGAAGVELAADAKQTYPQKNVTLVHSRQALMHRFEVGLQTASLRALEGLGITVLLNERVLENVDGKTALLRSGRTLPCGLLIDCVGQRPASNLIDGLAPGSIASSGHIEVKPTLQIADDSLPNIFVCGDVARVQIPKPNARAAMSQATVVADNIILAIQNKPLTHTYKPHWIEGVIKLTLGLHESVIHFGDGKNELLRPCKEKKITLMADETWRAMGVDPNMSLV